MAAYGEARVKEGLYILIIYIYKYIYIFVCSIYTFMSSIVPWMLFWLYCKNKMTKNVA